MILRSLTRAVPALLLFLTPFLTTLPLVDGKKEPSISKTKLDHPPLNLFYFEDSDVVLFQDKEAREVWRSPDAGETWDVIDDAGQKGQVYDLWQHPHDKERAYILGRGEKHWVTENRGKSWRSFETDATPSFFRAPFSFHAGNSDKVLLHGQVCQGFDCTETVHYTTDGFKTLKELRQEPRGCNWANAQPQYEVPNDDKDDNRIMCVVKGRYSPLPKDQRLVVSDNFFKDEVEPYLEGERTVQGIIEVASVKRFFVAAAKAEGTDELALYVTADGHQWHRAEFGNHVLEEDAYTILESTNYSIEVNVMSAKRSTGMGTLFTSNSNGTYFKKNIEHVNRNQAGWIDFEKIAGIQGILLVNTVENWQDIDNSPFAEKSIQSKISFDDGRTFEGMKADGKDLHLHSVTDLANTGRVFSTLAPGLVMGVGNTGKRLKEYTEGDLFVSDDAGLTWKHALDGAHLYEIGDQGSILLAIDNEDSTSTISYSINHGKDWKKADLGDKVRARLLTTTPDSTSLKFLLYASIGGGSSVEHAIFSVDFEGLHEGKCEDKDFENWPARLDENGGPGCLMGHKQFYRRRKADADCFIDEEFKDPVPKFEKCKCSAKDYECDFNFIRSDDGKDCVLAGPLKAPEGECENPGNTFVGSSGFRKIPGNACEGGENLEKDVERPCKDSVKRPASGKISVEKTRFDASRFREYRYFERASSSTGDDETVIMRTDEQEVYLTKDHGKTWTEILKGEDIIAVYPHKYYNDVVFFLTGTKKVYYSTDRGKRIRSFEAETEPTHDPGLLPLSFHPDEKEWLIWTGSKDCDTFSGDCHSVAYFSDDRGDHWKTLLRYVKKCEFVPRGDTEAGVQLVYCEQYADEDQNNSLQLLSSENWFSDSKKHFGDIIDFATMSEFIIVAARAENQKSLKVDASVDGRTFADAMFPPNFDVPVQKAYTVLDSSTHSVFLHVTVGTRPDHEYGTIIKSNSNGTNYVVSKGAVNRNSAGYVDFEKMQGLEGVAVINVVDNVKEAENGQIKKLKSMITHNDGAEWALIAPPEKDVDGNKFGCKVEKGKGTKDCSLHLHGYTERDDPRDTFSSGSAIGLMMAVGNVGNQLTRKDKADTFITRDGGIEWHMVKKGNYQWEYGDQGAIIVIVSENEPTNVLFYTLDEGKTWTEYQFSDEKMEIADISTVPSDMSRNFLLWGKDVGKPQIATVNLDFTGLTDKECVFDEQNPNSDTSDYYLWEPRHPLQEGNCLFGHVAQFVRKKPKSNCYNGRPIIKFRDISKNCSCTRQDFEW